MNDEYLGFTVYKYNTNGNNINSASDATPATTISYDDIDKNNGAYVYYTRNIWTLKFHSNNEDVKTEDVYYQADLSEYGTFVPTNGPVGHRFAGWYADPAFGTEFDFDTTMINASVTVYAKWEKLQYHVHLNTNGGELYGTQIGDFDVDFEETLDRTSLENSVRRENWVLVGWFDEATGKAYAYGKVTSDVNLIAKWRFPGLVKVVYDAGENGTNPPSDNGNYSGASAVVVGRPSDANPGYMFVGWKIQGVENSANYLPNDIFEIPDEAIVIDPNDPDRGTVTLVADYLLIDMTVFGKTSITFYPNGGSGTEETISNLHINESTQALAASVAGTREGYRFVGWSKKAGLENYTDADIFCQPGQTIFADNDGVDNKLYAAWRKILTIEIVGNHASNPYDGTKHEVDGYEVIYKIGNEIVSAPTGVTIALASGASAHAERTDVGTTNMGLNENSFVITSTDYAFNPETDLTVMDGYQEISRVTVTITAKSNEWIYSGSPHTEPGFTVEGLPENDTHTFTVVMTADSTITHVGTQPNVIATVDGVAVVPGTQVQVGNYLVTVVSGTLTITAKAVVVKADDAGKVYDNDPTNPSEYTATVTGLVGSDTITYTVTREAGEDVGTYTITPAGDATQGNYTVTYETGTFTITAAELSITINDASKVYGDADPELTYTAEGLVNGETIPEDLITIWRDAGEDVGTYPIHGKIGPKTSIRRMVYKPVKAGSTFDVNNYNITINEGTFEITPAEVTVTADSFTKKQGEADPTLTAKVTGLVNGDDESVISYSLNREAGEKPGIYAITPTGEAVQGNYKVTFVSGKLTIKEKDKEIEFGEFSLMWVSDTLLKGEGAYDDAFKAIVDYAEKNAKAFGTIAMIGTGNMVDAFDNEAAWNSAKNSLKDLTKVQFFSVAGTKDVNGDEMSYDAYLAAKLSGRATSYKDGSVWYRSFGSKNLMLVGIGYQKIAETDEEKDRQNKWLAFVNETIAIHRSEKVILILNDYMDETGELTPFGKLIEEKIVKGNKNVCMVLCGNANGAVHKEMAYGERKVAVAMFNYAADEENGLGLVRVITINPMTKTVEIQTIDAIEGEARAYDPLKPEEDSFRFEDLF